MTPETRHNANLDPQTLIVGELVDSSVQADSVLRRNCRSLQQALEHVNPGTSPPHMRLLCRLRAPWPDGYEPLSGPEYQPIAA